MSKIRKPILVVATLIFIIGGVTTGMALVQIYPIVQGTDENDLKRGIGHYVESVMRGAMLTLSSRYPFSYIGSAS